jgi:Mrp family chromosome partitioning ATPase
VKTFSSALDRERPPRDMKQDAQVTAPEQKPAEVAPVMDLTGQLAIRTPTVQVDPLVLERARVLPAGASGPHGAAYKMLRTQVLKRLEQIGATTLAVVSACAADGKTLTAINLAIAIAATTGRTALLVDADLRNPNVGQRFGIEPQVGFEDCIEERRPVHEALIKVSGYERLTLLPARTRNEHSSDLLSVARTRELVTEMRTRYSNRIVIFDLPPVLQADDALAFSQHIQAALLVVSERHTKREDVTRTLELLRDTPVIGTVLNASRTREMRYY